jgi:hypothetical protein
VFFSIAIWFSQTQCGTQNDILSVSDAWSWIMTKRMLVYFVSPGDLHVTNVFKVRCNYFLPFPTARCNTFNFSCRLRLTHVRVWSSLANIEWPLELASGGTDDMDIISNTCLRSKNKNRILMCLRTSLWCELCYWTVFTTREGRFQGIHFKQICNFLLNF